MNAMGFLISVLVWLALIPVWFRVVDWCYKILKGKGDGN